MLTNDQRSIVVAADSEALARLAAQRLIARIELRHDHPAICLTGGSGPKRLYELLAGEFEHRIPWARVHWFIGDERFVPSDDPRNNMTIAQKTFLDGRAPAANIHPIPTDLASPDEAARSYQATLQAYYGAGQFDPQRPLFDLVLMGVGPDGHTASLFPGAPALDERARWVVGVPRANVEPFVPRVTLTLPALASCEEMLFLVSGDSKREIASRVLSGEDLPAGRARSNGKTVWLLDQAALPESFHGG
ncbi:MULTISPECIES: 6-phosphogluconolactonase [Rhodopseudomonas]|uniref:6-phosphogluconolactonase n=1 Tax=Rhodopseudomonas palustris TaxID=1076 RepID=A0A0D7EZY9_RHOPL|nr:MULTISPECIES: 6-phosphogluconolactonase [Rhodopseudomonas]KIZ46409.1 6-phosphogluconolactonase [Rhodopseudomonas palustris]MDF3809669.1 6-phosphogluconolactonase [Rhodopseudomonas sp. BAL398]WOK18223.1 6-phosphogluconolactonase [Rhodopseudomonas sp. BAL398]